jgi:hypothetical protein
MGFIAWQNELLYTIENIVSIISKEILVYSFEVGHRHTWELLPQKLRILKPSNVFYWTKTLLKVWKVLQLLQIGK